MCSQSFQSCNRLIGFMSTFNLTARCAIINLWVVLFFPIQIQHCLCWLLSERLEFCCVYLQQISNRIFNLNRIEHRNPVTWRKTAWKKFPRSLSLHLSPPSSLSLSSCALYPGNVDDLHLDRMTLIPKSMKKYRRKISGPSLPA